MIKIKQCIFALVCTIILVVIILNGKTILNRLDDIFSDNKEIVILPANGYQKNGEFLLVQQSDDYIPYNYNDLLNIFYSVLNQGWDKFTFYCPTQYKECLEDVASISVNDVLLSEINNYVHPYNNYSYVKTLYDDTGEVTIKITYLYTDDEIKKIDAEINRLLATLIRDNMSDKEKVKVLHDYIINNTKYDKTKEETDKSKYDSSRMTGLLFEHYSVCSGYTDVMSVMLEKLNIKNFRIASDEHIWNAVYINNTWLHLDLTWDDPVSANGKDVLDHSYFLITDEKLTELDKKEKEHVFNRDYYLEFKK